MNKGRKEHEHNKVAVKKMVTVTIFLSFNCLLNDIKNNLGNNLARLWQG